MIRGSAIHIAYRILAAFFIDMGAKTSIVENLRFINLKIIYLIFFNVQNRRITSSKFSVGYQFKCLLMILPQVHLRKPCYDFSFLQVIRFTYLSVNGPKGSPDHPVSVGATGGVYKGQGHNQRKMMTCIYQEFLVQDL